VDRDVGLVVEPRLKLGEKVLAADQRQSAGLGDEEVEFARRLARAGPAAAHGRRELLAVQRQADARVSPRVSATLLPSPVTTTGLCRGRQPTDRPCAASPVAGERLNQNHGDFAVRAHRCFEELLDGVALPSFVLARLDLWAFSPRTSSAGVHAFTLQTRRGCAGQARA